MSGSKRLQILELLTIHHSGMLWKQLLGKHTLPVTSGSLPDMTSPDRAKWLLDKSTFPANNAEVNYVEWCFSPSTLDRVLKELIKDGVVEKAQEPRKQGERGRPSGRYRIRHWFRWGCMYVQLPASCPAYPRDPRWFLGKKIEKRGVRMYPEEKKKFDHLMKEDETFRDAVLSARRKRRSDVRKERAPRVPSF